MNCLIYLRVSTKEQASKNAEKEGYSLPAQREACLRHIRDKGWSYVDEYVDRGESARSSQRPQLQEMLSRIKKDGTIDAVVVHKIDRLARNMEDHVAIKAILKKHKVSLVSVVENIEDSASGQFMEGILALMAEFYSANLAMETKKGQLQKVKSGGWPQMAPLGYLNVREFQIGRLIRYITVDEERAPFVKLAFELYSTGEYSLTELQKELAKRGFKSRPNRKSPGTPVAKSYIAKMLRNEFYTGVVVWQGVRYQGTQEPLVTKELFDRVQLVMDSHDQAGERKRKHPHYLRGTLYCGECGARLSSLIAKGEYTYFYCLGQKRKNGCGQLYVLDVDIEKQIEELYKRINLPSYYTDKLVSIFKQEIMSRDDANAREKQFLAARLSRLADKRVKLMDAFYADAISPELLKSEQDRIDGEVAACESRLALLKDKFDQFEEILNLAVKMASSCHLAYMKANPKRKRMLNQAFFKKILIKEKQIEEVIYTDLFDLLFRRSLNSDSLIAGAGL